MEENKKRVFVVKQNEEKKEERPRHNTKKENSWQGRSLENYKKQHAEAAEQKGVGQAFQNAPTLTAAKKILSGKKV